MKQTKASPPSQGVADGVSPELPQNLDIPQNIRAEDIAGVLAKLREAVPPLVGHDPVGRRKERLAIQGAFRLIHSATNYTPENPWDRETPYDKELQRCITTLMQASGAKAKARVQKNSPLETRIARCIFPDRRRANAASTVIRAAIKAGKGPDDLLEFIEQSGGTEAIRRRTGGSSADETLRLMWTTKPLATITQLSRELVGDQTSDMPKQMLFTVRRTGEVDVRWIGDNNSTARSALAAFAKEQKDKSVVTHDTSGTQQAATA